jgi:hypothetical protein
MKISQKAKTGLNQIIKIGNKSIMAQIINNNKDSARNAIEDTNQETVRHLVKHAVNVIK